MVDFRHLSPENERASEAVNAVRAYLEGDDYDNRFTIVETDDGYQVYWGDTDKLTAEDLTTVRNEYGTDKMGPDGEVFVTEGTEDEIRDIAE
ncbi:hypothetical protein ACOZ32_09320 [Halobacterium sp. MBLA0001]|uniref:hypothetical protein n=1 Tax=Halobacterium TaxID=2239 RepID=UPI0025531CFB|nr:hypothetical protein [Halobacterium salinarum]MDL0129292.1 hypothetical protein [Halobacterium salinarum]